MPSDSHIRQTTAAVNLRQPRRYSRGHLPALAVALAASMLPRAEIFSLSPARRILLTDGRVVSAARDGCRCFESLKGDFAAIDDDGI